MQWKAPRYRAILCWKKEGDGKLIKEKNILWQIDSSASVASASLKQKQVDSCFAKVNIGAKTFMKGPSVML